jgi:hypothetical protein
LTRDLTWGVPVPVKDDDEDQSMKGKVLCKFIGFLAVFMPNYLDLNI